MPARNEVVFVNTGHWIDGRRFEPAAERRMELFNPATVSALAQMRGALGTVSYTHLTLPTIYSV